MVKYIEIRTAKTQANREMSVLSIVWGCARKWGITALPWPAAGVKGWKNSESPRKGWLDIEVFGMSIVGGNLRGATNKQFRESLKGRDISEVGYTAVMRDGVVAE